MRILAVQQFRSFVSNSIGGIMSLDVGTKHIGIAITDASRRFVSPIGSVTRKKGLIDDRMSPEALTHLSKCIQQYVNEQRPIGIVLGFPLHIDGSLTPLCYEILRIGENLQLHRTDLWTAQPNPQEMVCTFWDERESTMEARDIIAGMSSRRRVVRKYKDSVAASVILRSFLGL
eukprot:gene34588-44717_t